MLVVISADGFYLLDQPISDIFIQVLNVEILILLVEVKKKLLFVLHFFVNPQECWNFVRQNVNKVFIRQILKQNLAPFSSVIC
jgi:hypothetical protein